MATPNRLGREKSPYLLSHAGNPVDWYPWGPEAFAAARARDAPLFVSIGYSACHWCHVMERECFEDERVARLMNEHLVAVKVDREELPAVDHLFMAYCQGMTGSGGWPLTVVLTPAGKPFFAGTYFPRESGVGRPGMLDLSPLLGRLWREQREQVLRTADELERALAAQLEPAPGELPGPGLVDDAARELFRLYDPRWGGFGSAPKFPTVPWLLFLLRYAERQGGDGGRARVVVEETLRAMRLGGIYDHLGYGFHRYSTDAGWLLPHFEKMLYDQALLALAYTEAHRLWGEAAFRRTAEETLAYVLRDLRAPAGGFAAAEDADSEGEEGRFYLWSRDEVTAVLGSEAAEEFAAAFHLRAGGNFTSEVGERSDRNILHRISPLAVSASDFTLPADLPEGLAASRASLLAAREKRVRPRRDDKVLADWNGLAIAALAKAAAVFAEPRYAGEAARAADFVLGKLRDDGGNLLHRWRDGEAACPGVVDDYAFLAWGLVELHGATGERRWLDEALRLADALEGRFGDGAGGLFFAPPDPLLPLRQRIAVDAALPAGAAVAAEVLARLGAAAGEPSRAERARRLIRALGGDIERAPLGCAHLLSASMLLGEGAS